jgi:hypothetical protein
MHLLPVLNHEDVYKRSNEEEILRSSRNSLGLLGQSDLVPFSYLIVTYYLKWYSVSFEKPQAI